MAGNLIEWDGARGDGRGGGMTACVHLPGVVDDYDAVTCLLCLRFELRSSLVCDCAEPDADPRRNFGECSKCRRKPLALMAVQS